MMTSLDLSSRSPVRVRGVSSATARFKSSHTCGVAEALLRVRLEVCVLESFVYEATAISADGHGVCKGTGRQCVRCGEG